MVRIRLPSGNIREFNGSDDLAQAIAAGEVGRDAEIYHAKSGRWVSVTGHPIFRRLQTEPPAPASVPDRDDELAPAAPEVMVPPASLVDDKAGTKPEEPAQAEGEAALTSALGQELSAAGTAPEPSLPTPPPPAKIPLLPSTAEERRGAPDSKRAGLPSPVHVPHPVLEMQSKSGEELAARRRSPWRLPAAVVVLGAVLAGLLWLNRERERETPLPATRPVPVRRPNVRQPPAIVPRDTNPPPASASQATPAAVEPLVLAGNHGRRADSLDSDLARTARQIGLIGFLGTERLTSDDSVQASRAALSRFVSNLTTYRTQQQQLSKVYNDSADAFVLSGAWDHGALREWQVRVRRPEPPAVAARADVLVAGLDSVLGLLHEFRGGYDITADQIRFKAPRASLQYDEMLRTVNANRVSQSEQISAPLSVLAEAMGGKRLPPSAHD